jgi:hypothetical protein
MATSSSLIKTILHKSLAEGVYRDVVTRSSNYYYFLGKTLAWGDELNPPYPVDSYAYERLVRSDIITMKQIGPSDVSFVIPRRNWTTGTIYDMYDDEYSTEILGLNIVSGGTSYTSLPTITVTGGGGSGASFTAVVFDGQIIDVDLVSKGSGYTSVPTVTVTGGNGTGADLRAVLNIASSGAQKLEDCTFYVMTEDYNVYKCLDNNNNAQSTIKPLGTDVTPIETSDGYRWKYMYNVPINLRNKFLSDDQIPVISALTNQFYSNGSLDSIIINNKGSGYSAATITVSSGTGSRVEDPTFLTSVIVNAGGSGYSTPTLNIGDPVSSASAFIGSSSVFLAQRLYNTDFDFYEVVKPGTLSSTQPTHRLGTVENGTTALKFVGTRAKGTVSLTTPTISGVAISGTGGQFTCTATTIAVGNLIAISGTFGGTGSITGYSNPTTYKVSAITGSGSSVTGFTLTTEADVAIVTTAGTPTGLTYSNTSRKSVDSVTLTGAVREVNLISNGSGYTTAPVVAFSGGGGANAVGVAKMNAVTGSVLYVTITNPGDNYTSNPDIHFGSSWSALAAVLVGEQYYFSNRLYTVSTAGFFGSASPSHTTGTVVNSAAFASSTALTLNSTVYVSNRLYKVTTAGTTHASTVPSHTTGTVTNGTAGLLYLGVPAQLTYAGQPASGTVVRRFGAGYATAPEISITEIGASGAEVSFQTSASQAKLLPILDGGQIVGVTVENAGIGYSDATISVTGDGTGAALSADLSVGNISSLQANNEILTVPGTINAIKIISGGYGYGVANIEIQGDGTGATATATVDTATGKITKINVTNVGQNYTFANVVVTGNGKGARLRAIMPPFGGHGRNAPDELFARTLMFYSNVSTDLNQGVAINNDYRQLGIIKNPRVYGTNNRFQGSIGSACFIIEGSINTTFFPKDTDVVVNRTIDGDVYERRYRVVASSSTSALLQSLDNDIPLVNDTFENAASQTFTVLSVGSPTIDKYSGQMMFIDNKAGFTPSADETVTLRTVIRF